MIDLNQQILKFDYDQNFKDQDFYVSNSNQHTYNLLNSWPKWEKNFINLIGEKYSGKQVSFQPFLETELKNRVSRYKTKKFLVTMSENIPGFIYKIETYIEDLENPDDKVKETLTFQGIRTNKQLRDAYKKRKEDS